jgi:hypothetical protein
MTRNPSPPRERIETELVQLFERQAGAVPVHPRAFVNAPMVDRADVAPRRPRKVRALATVAAIAAVAALVVGIVDVRGHDRVQTRTPAGRDRGQGAVAAVNWQTAFVSLRATSLVIDVAGKQFTAAGAQVQLHSDPGDPSYWTLESGWHEHGVEMRLFVYFASDGRDSWATEIRTYNGKPQGDWVAYLGTFFRAPLGSSFTGDLDLADAKSGTSLHLRGVQLSTHPKRFDCSRATGAYTIQPRFGPSFESSPGMTSLAEGIVLLDTRSCAVPPLAAHATFEWVSLDPAIATVAASDCIQLVDRGACERHAVEDIKGVAPGSTALRVTAHDASGAVLAVIDLPIVVR